MRDRHSVLITGGGTAGHVFPALAVAEAMVVAGYPRSSVHFVGSRRGMEGRLVSEAGFDIVLLSGRGIVRRLSLANVTAVVGLFRAFMHSLVLVARLRPKVIVTVGGYASVPCSFAGALAGVPIVVVNTDAAPGLANRVVGHIARASAVAFAGTALPRSVVTGAPVRAEIEQASRTIEARRASRNALGVPDGAGRRFVAVIGGSLGARRLNEVAYELAERCSTREDLFIYHVVGERNAAAAEQFVATHRLGTNYRNVAFESRMPELLSAADLVICRSGAMTVAELSIVGVPSVLVPLPGAPNDHQMLNARALQTVGAAVILRDDQLTVDRLLEVVDDLAFDDPRLEKMADAGRRLGQRDAARAIVAVVDNVVLRSRRGATQSAGD